MATGRPDPIELTHQQRATVDALQTSSEVIPPPAWMVQETSIDYLPDPIKGERIMAFVVLKSGVEEGPSVVGSLRDHVREDLGPIAQPSEIAFRKSLPKTRSGKIVRRLLKSEALGEDPGDLSTLAD